MPDTPSPEPTPPAEAGTPTTVTNISGGVNLDAQRDVNIGGDVVGGDKTTTNIDTAGGANVAGNVTLSEGSEFVGRDKIIYEASTPIVTSLHQLPPPPRDFTGREAELTELMSEAETDGVTISGLQGMGGVGKTVLALMLAEQLKSRYPDAQFYLDLKGADRQPLSVTAALTHVIRAYHPLAQLPDSEAELRGMYLSVLDGQRALLLMDNAADKSQVEPLIPPSSCFLLVTSRQHFTLPGLFPKDLNTLPSDDARDLLLRIAPRIGLTANTLAKLCGYLPLALRLAGSALAERRTLTPKDYLMRLGDAQTRLELVEASLGLSYDLLTEELQRAWGALVVFPDTFAIAAAAAVWNIKVNLAQDRLDELMRYSLVEWNEANGRARLHDLTRLFANNCFDGATRMDYQRRYATHYQGVSATADTFYQQGGEQLMQGLALFDLEWTNIQAGHAWAEQYADQDEQALSLCDDYPAECYNVLHLRQHPRERIQWLKTALIAAHKLARKQAEGWHLGNLGIAYRAIGEYRRAIEYYEQDLTIAREIGDRLSEGHTLGNLGGAYYYLGEYRRAIEYLEKHLTIARDMDDLVTVGHALGNLGLAYYSLGESFRAIEYYEQSLAIARDIGDRLSEGHALSNLGIAYTAQGRYRHAIEYYEQSLTIACDIGDRLSEGTALSSLGIAYAAQGEYRRAIEYHEQALTIRRAIGDRLGEGHAINNLGSAYYYLDEYRRATEYYEEALSIVREIGDRFGEAHALWGLAVCFDAANDRLQAIAHAKAALDIFIAIESPDAEAMRDLLADWHQ